ncbi:T9SS type A sorting domain-containing protein [Nibribacter ruber]|uniref:T9SS type A sorting domain-containing protein n=1 Tax=Nibribacter ruber TaxID=2698458 RepID=A0A6P1P2A6_9BACT|nr:YDG domain-containing protein [Nibribacter ruber]QHL88528.1 T9SS type A sorting domain-containing protein [Nibribacter ruber]
MQHFYTSKSLVQEQQGAKLKPSSSPSKLLVAFFSLILFIGISWKSEAQSISIVSSAYCPGGQITITANQPASVNGNVSYTVDVVASPTETAPSLQQLVTGNVFSTKQNTPTATYTATFSTTLNYSGTLYLRAIPNNAGGNLPAVYSPQSFTLVASPPSPTTGTSSTVSYVYGDAVTGKTLSVTPLDGQTINWYSAATGGTAIATNSSTYTPSVTNVGTYKYYAEAAGAGCVSTTRTEMTLVITARPLSITATASNKVYDGNTTATVNLSSNKLTNDALTISFTSATFSDKNIGTGKTVTVAGISISGTSSSNYTLSSTTATTTANITAKALTISGLAGITKVYDGNTTATLTAATLVGVISPDAVTLSAAGTTGTYNTKNVGTGKAVTVTGYTITGGGIGNYTLTQPTGVTGAITAKVLTVSGLTGVSKVYDGTTTATLSGTATLVGVISPDVINISGASATANFADKNIGTGKAITVAGYSLSGTGSTNYTLTQPTGLAANITAKALTISGLAGITKVYDGNTTATLTAATLVGVISPDAVTLSSTGATGTYADKNVGSGKAITVAGYTITGGGIGNYTLTQPSSVTGAITGKSLTISGLTGVDKVYDGTTTGSLSGNSALIGIVGSDVVTISAATASTSFLDKNVGSNKPLTVAGYSLGGAEAGNYSLTQPTGLTANISAKSLTVTGITATSKEYDGTTVSTLYGAVLQNVISGDDVSLATSSVAGIFEDPNVGTGKTVTRTELYSLSGTSVNNYTLTQPALTYTADITPKTLRIINVIAKNRDYDGTTKCDLEGIADLDGLVNTDAGKIIIGGTATAMFLEKNAGLGRSATVTGYALSGNASDLANYTLEPFFPKADIAQIPLTVNVISENKKDTKGNPIVSLFTTNVLTGDTVDLAYANAKYVTDATTGYISIDVTGISISGKDAGNYDLKTIQAMGINPLPVTLVSFTGKYNSKTGVMLAWSTATEKDNAYFQVERSTNGKTFNTIGQVKGNGNSSTLIKYQFVDGQPANGTAYYRLKQVDVDGKFEYTKVIAVNTQGASMAVGIIKAYPNPTYTGKVSLEAGRGQGGTAVITLLNGNGQIISKQEVVLQEGQAHELDLSQQKAGMYYLRVENAAGQSTSRIVRQ